MITSLLGAAVLSAIGMSVARADTVADAKDLFARARDLRGQGDCASALPLFRKAYELYPSGLGSLRNTAECEEFVGHFASSRRAWLDLKRALVTNDDRKYEGWAHDADEAAARLLPKLATLTLDIHLVAASGATAPGDGVEVRLNSEVLAPGLTGTPLERDPGHYVIQVAGPRVSAPQERAVDLVAGDAQRVALRVVVSTPGQPGPEGAASPPPTELAPGSEPAQASPAPSSDQGTHPGSTRRVAAWVALGVGAAGVIGTVASAVVRQSALGAVENNGHCHDDSGWICDASQQPALQSNIDTGRTASALVNVFLAAGLVGAVTGVVLLATDRPGARGVGLVLSPTGAWAAGRF